MNDMTHVSHDKPETRTPDDLMSDVVWGLGLFDIWLLAFALAY